MADKIVDIVAAISSTPRIDSFQFAVRFNTGRSAFLDMSQPEAAVYEEVLNASKEMACPTYVEVNSETQVITRVLIPLVVRVVGLSLLATGDVELEFDPSAAQHFLRQTLPEFAKSLEILEWASTNAHLVLVTEDLDGYEIVNVRVSPDPFEPATEVLSPAKIESAACGSLPVPPETARWLFDLVGRSSCEITAITSPCIPFRYPNDGCWARAHELCRVISMFNIEIRKLWIYGHLEVETDNTPRCRVFWKWHVAPIVKVSNGASSEMQVIDPSIFGSPVTVAVWKSRQNDTNAQLVTTAASVFLRGPKGEIQYDPDGAKTQRALDIYRLRFKLRVASIAGPPPYARCHERLPLSLER